ncbi:GntR family transcriptional regulator [Desemzia sp. RIT 804]|uniref:GntR family transcriptional regulator n=1 Tax=Desemzia sp. RIT 804 TaxID=2810209 RepID=UPI00351C99F6
MVNTTKKAGVLIVPEIFNQREPVYLQVVRHFKEKIAAGELRPGEEMPSRRELAGNLGINPNTVQRAYKRMEEENLLYTEGNMPSKITEDTNVLTQVRHELMLDAVETFIAAVKPIGVSLEELQTKVEEQFLLEDVQTGGEKND